MNPILHIIWKDFRALRWPLLILGVGLALLALERLTLFDVVRMERSPIAMFLVVVLAGMSVALVASLVQDDSPISPTAFWRTRPIARGRLLTAKLLASWIIFVPAFTPLFLVSRGREYGVFGGLPASDSHLLNQMALATGVMVFTIAIAALARDLKQFLVGSVLALSTYAVMLAFSMEISQNSRIYRGWWGNSQFDAALLLTGFFCMAPCAWLFFGGERKFGIVLLLAALVLGPLFSLV